MIVHGGCMVQPTWRKQMKGGVCDAKNMGQNGVAERQWCMEAKAESIPRTLESDLVCWKYNGTGWGYFGTCSTFYYNFTIISSKNNSSYSKIPTSCIKILNFLYKLYYNFYLFQLIIIFNNFIHHKKISKIIITHLNIILYYF